jgi:hypothetical protein
LLWAWRPQVGWPHHPRRGCAAVRRDLNLYPLDIVVSLFGGDGIVNVGPNGDRFARRKEGSEVFQARNDRDVGRRPAGWAKSVHVMVEIER